MSRRTLHVITYDITDDGRRTKLAKLLLDYGDRMQYSLFEAELEPGDVETILKRAEDLVEPTDSLRVYALCASCCERVQTLGRRESIESDDLVVI